LLVAERGGLSRTQAATLIANGNVLVSGRREKASYKPRAGEKVAVEIPVSAKRELLGENIPLEIVFEDDALLVVDKPAGMVVHPAPGNWSGTLVNALVGRSAELARDDDDRAGIVHRLDKETSGLLIVAKTEKSHRLLSAAIAARRVARRYAVMIWGHLKTDAVTVEKPVARDPRDRKRMAIVSTGRAARTDLFRLARFDSGDLLRAQLHTGRTHQIRVHLASIGHPVVGDDTYGGGGGRKVAGLPAKRHFLHAAWLQFNHPISGAPMDLRSPLPPELDASLRAMAGEFEIGSDPLTEFGFYA
jgi:23S rRNA pseudouridine1911/1915/1917 synthase